MMRTITLSDGREMSTNQYGHGVFCRQTNGAWAQWAGTSQTPTFRTVQQFRAYLRNHYDGFRGVRIVSTAWND